VLDGGTGAATYVEKLCAGGETTEIDRPVGQLQPTRSNGRTGDVT